MGIYEDLNKDTIAGWGSTWGLGLSSLEQKGKFPFLSLSYSTKNLEKPKTKKKCRAEKAVP